MEFLAGLHPRLVHFPIALFILYFFLETFGIVLSKEYLSKTAYIVLAAGVVTALGAVLTGNQAQDLAKQILKNNYGSYGSSIDLHEEFATITLWYFFAMLVLRTYLVLKKKFSSKLKYVFIPLGLLGCYLIYITGVYGGELVFKYGIGTQLLGK
ncbi:MAG: DUF2231 domain-containing protein [Bacteroidetes bacterium]|nr:DUF2231 domain-containing protein [Bacteroidota bacterium]